MKDLSKEITQSVWKGKLWDLELLKVELLRVVEIDGDLVPDAEPDKTTMWGVYRRPSARNRNYYGKDRLAVWLQDFPDRSSAVEFIVYLRKLLNPKKSRKPRKMQVLLDLVINSGKYKQECNYDAGESRFMCEAVSMSNKLTEEEKDKVTRKIDKYIKGAFSLEDILRSNGLPSDFEDRLFLYRNWKKRPVLLNKVQY